MMNFVLVPYLSLWLVEVISMLIPQCLVDVGTVFSFLYRRVVAFNASPVRQGIDINKTYKNLKSEIFLLTSYLLKNNAVWFCMYVYLLPIAYEVWGGGYVFTPVCHSVQRERVCPPRGRGGGRSALLARQTAPQLEGRPPGRQTFTSHLALLAIINKQVFMRCEYESKNGIL